MACFSPLKAWRKAAPSEKGRLSFTWVLSERMHEIAVNLPCGQCIGCRLERSRQWAVRCMHEAQLYERNCFVTLTYDDDHLPSLGSLVRRDVQLFFKRLRKRRRFRFFGCGEYGEVTNRPHYHICLFGTDFDDRRYWRTSGSGSNCFRSSELEEFWTLGNSEIGEVNFESAAYAARYCLKKVTGELAEDHYAGRSPEFSMMSLKPGIGAGWYERFGAQVVNHDSVIVRGREMRPPRFYDKYLDRIDPARFDLVYRLRFDKRYANWEALRADSTPARLDVRAEVVRSRLRAKENL